MAFGHFEVFSSIATVQPDLSSYFTPLLVHQFPLRQNKTYFQLLRTFPLLRLAKDIAEFIRYTTPPKIKLPLHSGKFNPPIETPIVIWPRHFVHYDHFHYHGRYQFIVSCACGSKTSWKADKCIGRAEKRAWTLDHTLLRELAYTLFHAYLVN